MPRTANTGKFIHNRTENLELPYVTNLSVTDGRPRLISGSVDIMTTPAGELIKRHGFIDSDNATLLTDPIKRFYYWENGSNSFILLSTVATDSKVYKMKLGVDTNYGLIHTCSTNTEPFDFVAANNFLYFANGADMKKYDGTTVTNWGSAAPAATPTASAGGPGNVPAHIGHFYCYTYGVAATGYQTDISELSLMFDTDDQDVDLVGARSVDAQIDQVHIFRTEDGGANMFELSNSPIANPVSGSWALTDNDADIDLNFSSPAPLRGVNSVPPQLFHPRYFAGRIWGYYGDAVWFSTLEENNTSVPEECFGTEKTNRYRFGRNIRGLGVAADFLLVFTSHGIHKIGGDSLVTFFRSTLSKNLGAHSRQNIDSHEGTIAWLDTSNTVRVTDGYTVGKPDITLPIRPDIANIIHSTAAICVHDDGNRQWIILMDGTNAKLYIFDVNSKLWYPPWSLSGITAIGSNTLFINTISFQVARGGRNQSLTAVLGSDHNPATGATTGFGGQARLALTAINADNPTGINDVEYVGIERNSVAPTTVSILIDEDPASGTYVDITPNVTDPDQRTNGTALVEKWYWHRTQPGQRASVKIEWASATTIFKLFSLDIAHRADK